MSTLDDYIAQHKDPKRYRGGSFKKHGDLLKKHMPSDVRSIMDFGSGKGWQYSELELHQDYLRGILPTCYDPAYPKFAQLPTKKFDMVLSTDVLEHIEPDEIDSALELIYSKARKFVYHGIANWETKRMLSDGRDSHLIQEDINWWVDKIKPYAKVDTLIWVDTKWDKSKRPEKIKKKGHGVVLIQGVTEVWL